MNVGLVSDFAMLVADELHSMIGKDNEMRDLKFRAWDEVTQSFIYSDKIAGGMWRYFKTLEDRGIRHFESEEWTGVKDDSGQDIYEGDILERTDGSKVIIKYSVNAHSFEWYSLQDSFRYWNSDSSQWELSKIVGNIHEEGKWITK